MCVISIKNAIPHHVLTLTLYIFDVANPELSAVYVQYTLKCRRNI